MPEPITLLSAEVPAYVSVSLEEIQALVEAGSAVASTSASTVQEMWLSNDSMHIPEPLDLAPAPALDSVEGWYGLEEPEASVLEEEPVVTQLTPVEVEGPASPPPVVLDFAEELAAISPSLSAELNTIQEVEQDNSEIYTFLPTGDQVAVYRSMLSNLRENRRAASTSIKNARIRIAQQFMDTRSSKKDWVALLRIQSTDDIKLLKAVHQLSDYRISTPTWEALSSAIEDQKTKIQELKRLTQMNTARLDRQARELKKANIAFADAQQTQAVTLLNKEGPTALVHTKNEIATIVNNTSDFEFICVNSPASNDQNIEIVFRMTGLHASPSNGQEHIAREFANTSDVDIYIHPCDVTLYMSIGGDVRFSGEDGRYFLGYDNGELIHPHWLSNNDFCFGDFGPSISSAARGFDIATVLTLFRTVLGSYDPSDSAGVSFTRWLGIEDQDCTNAAVCDDCGEYLDDCGCN